MTIVIVDIPEVLVVLHHHIYVSHCLTEDQCLLTLNKIVGDLFHLIWMVLLLASLSLCQVLEVFHQDLMISVHSDLDHLVDMIVGK